MCAVYRDTSFLDRLENMYLLWGRFSRLGRAQTLVMRDPLHKLHDLLNMEASVEAVTGRREEQ